MDSVMQKMPPRDTGVPPVPDRSHGRDARVTRKLILVLSLVLFACNALAEESLTLLPGTIALRGPSARHAVLVEKTHEGQFIGQAAHATVTSSDEKVLMIEDGVLVPVGNGKALITAIAGGRTASAEVTVTGIDKPADWSFRNDVQPVLTRAGCNSGACHGAAAGKNGFHLSLRGYDDEGDYWTLTRQALGRRINPADPGHSLMLLKPTTAVPHKGGERFKVNSPEYQILSEWIASGTLGPKPDDTRVQSIEVIPNHVTLKPKDPQQVLVLAHFSDGSERDVTHWAKFNATESSAATVDESGEVKCAGHGEGAITAWYLSKMAVATVTSPNEGQVPADSYAGARNVVDEIVLEKLKSLNLPTSPVASDAEFLRRAFIDTIGVLPTADEVRSFLTDSSSDKCDRLIESLLARPEFVDYWTYKWSDLLLVSSRKLNPQEMWSYYHWVRDRVASNTPWDQVARELVTATGSVRENGAANFYVLHADPTEVSETLSVSMLGMSIACAKCHNHPMEKWTNGQYYGMANLFARTRVKAGPDGAPVVFTAAEGELNQPLTGKPQPPRPLDAPPVPGSYADRREYFADWLTSKNNPYFARAIVNRVWANFMGVGLVEKVDDMRVSNPPSNEKLLTTLAEYLVQNHYDLKQLMRLILQSQTYQRSSAVTGMNVGDTRFYSHHYPRRIMAEVLLDAMSQAAAAPTAFANYPAGWRATQLPDSNIDSYFLKSFGRPDRILTCECERTSNPSMGQAMHIANGDTVNQKLEAKGNRITQLLDEKASNEKIVEDSYLWALSRFPTEAEKQQIVGVLKDAGDNKRQAIEDLYWGLLSSNEFLFDH